jgi:hypothetical protein
MVVVSIRHSLCNNILPEFFEMKFIQLLRQESSTPCAAVNPVNNLIYGKKYLLFGFYRQQFPANPGVSSSSAANGYEKMPVFCFQKIKMAGLDAYPALDALVLFEF